MLNGQKVVVIGAPLADHLMVTARSSSGQRDRDGITVALVERSAVIETLDVLSQPYGNLCNRAVSRFPNRPARLRDALQEIA